MGQLVSQGSVGIVQLGQIDRIRKLSFHILQNIGKQYVAVILSGFLDVLNIYFTFHNKTSLFVRGICLFRDGYL